MGFIPLDMLVMGILEKTFDEDLLYPSILPNAEPLDNNSVLIENIYYCNKVCNESQEIEIKNKDSARKFFEENIKHIIKGESVIIDNFDSKLIRKNNLPCFFALCYFAQKFYNEYKIKGDLTHNTDLKSLILDELKEACKKRRTLIIFIRILLEYHSRRTIDGDIKCEYKYQEYPKWVTYMWEYIYDVNNSKLSDDRKYYLLEPYKTFIMKLNILERSIDRIQNIKYTFLDAKAGKRVLKPLDMPEEEKADFLSSFRRICKPRKKDSYARSIEFANKVEECLFRYQDTEIYSLLDREIVDKITIKNDTMHIYEFLALANFRKCMEEWDGLTDENLYLALLLSSYGLKDYKNEQTKQVLSELIDIVCYLDKALESTSEIIKKQNIITDPDKVLVKKSLVFKKKTISSQTASMMSIVLANYL